MVWAGKMFLFPTVLPSCVYSLKTKTGITEPSSLLPVSKTEKIKSVRFYFLDIFGKKINVQFSEPEENLWKKPDCDHDGNNILLSQFSSLHNIFRIFQKSVNKKLLNINKKLVKCWYVATNCQQTTGYKNDMIYRNKQFIKA